MNKIISARFECYGTASWEFDYDVEQDTKYDECEWPSFHNSDTELVNVTLEDGTIIDLRTKEGCVKLEELLDQDIADISWELWEKQAECEEWAKPGEAA